MCSAGPLCPRELARPHLSSLPLCDAVSLPNPNLTHTILPLSLRIPVAHLDSHLSRRYPHRPHVVLPRGPLDYGGYGGGGGDDLLPPCPPAVSCTTLPPWWLYVVNLPTSPLHSPLSLSPSPVLRHPVQPTCLCVWLAALSLSVPLPRPTPSPQVWLPASGERGAPVVLGKPGAGDGQFSVPTALALAPSIGLVVRESGNGGRFQVGARCCAHFFCTMRLALPGWGGCGVMGSSM
jgi:hypothetical protein